MREGQFSRTALGAAGRRAAHQVVDGARVFADPLALRILGPDADAAVAEARADPAMRGLRLYVAMRSRFAEDAARRAIARGVRQVVVLGAGLDTFAYRVEPVEGLRVTEVDHPATQAEKRRRLAAAGIAAPSHVVYAGCDFETRRSGGRASRGAGSTPGGRRSSSGSASSPISTEPAIFATLAALSANCRAAAKSYSTMPIRRPRSPKAVGGEDMKSSRREKRSRRRAAEERLRDAGAARKAPRARLSHIEDLGPNEIAARFFPERAAPSRENGGHFILAGTF